MSGISTTTPWKTVRNMDRPVRFTLIRVYRVFTRTLNMFYLVMKIGTTWAMTLTILGDDANYVVNMSGNVVRTDISIAVEATRVTNVMWTVRCM